MHTRKSVVWIGSFAAVWAGLAAAPAIWAEAAPDSVQVNKLLTGAKVAALRVKDDAVAMEGFTRMNLSAEAHATAINQIKDHVNDLVRAATNLNEAESQASPWQRTAIRRIAPFLDELEGYTYAVIENVNDQPNRLFTPEYKDFLAANADYSTDLAAMISDFVNYGKTREKVERLAVKLEIPTR